MFDWNSQISVENIKYFSYKYLFYWIKFVNYIKLFKIQGTGCDNVNVPFMWSQNNGPLIYFFNLFEFWHVSSFYFIWEKDGKVFGKNTVKFWHNIIYKVNAFVFHYIWQLWLIKISQSSAGENAKGNIMCIAIIMTHHWLTIFPK